MNLFTKQKQAKNRNKLTDIENKLTVIKGDGEGRE